MSLRITIRSTDDFGQFVERSADVTYELPPSPPPPGNVTFSGLVRLSGEYRVPVGQPAVFDPNVSTTVETTSNFIVNGDLVMQPANPDVVHALRFINVNESRFVGGGMDPLPTDVGLWTMGNGRLLLRGTPRRWMARLVRDVPAGVFELEVDADVSSWRPGDELVIAPSNQLSAGRQGNLSDFGYDYDFAVVQSAAGRTVRLRSALRFAHPMWNVGGTNWGAEVLNLTRNVRIEGTPVGKSHVLIRSTRPSDVRYTSTRHLGPIQNNDGVLGRWGGLHFHHSMDGSRGTVVEGHVDVGSGGHSYVAHVSHGITFRQCISHDCFDNAYWWDQSDLSTDVTYEDCVASLVKNYDQARGFRLDGFNLGQGDLTRFGSRNTIRRPTVFGVRGFVNASGIHWPESPSNSHSRPPRPANLWHFEGPAVIHHCNEGIFGWQNDQEPHDIFGAYIYACYSSAVDWGAYSNHANIGNIYVSGASVVNAHAAPYGAYIVQHSVARTGRPLVYRDMILDGNERVAVGYLELQGQNSTDQPVLVQRVTFRGFTHSALRFQAGGQSTQRRVLVRDCVIEGSARPFWLESEINPGSQLIVESVTINGVRQGPFTLRPNVGSNPGIYRPEWNARVA